MIAGKTELEILSINQNMRTQWYKTILPEEKEKAMKIVEVARRSKISRAVIGKNNPSFGKSPSEKTRAKISVALMGEKNPMYGNTHTEEVRIKISASHKGKVLSEKTKMLMSEAHKGKYIGPEHPSWEGGPIEYICKNCGKAFIRKRSGLVYQFCSKLCSSEYHTGSLNGNWQGGKSFEPYGLEFNNGLREQIRKRDNFICQECGKIEEVLGCKLDVHHIDYDKTNNKPENLICLCKSCHAKTGFNREDWINYFKKIMKIYNVENKNLNIWVM